MRLEDISIGDEVVYIPHHLLTGEKDKMVENKNLGVVTAKNDRFVFVRYLGKEGSEATNPTDLFTLANRDDLREILRNDGKSAENPIL